MSSCDCPFRILDPKLDLTPCVTCGGVIAPMNATDRWILAYEEQRQRDEAAEQRGRWQGGGQRQ